MSLPGPDTAGVGMAILFGVFVWWSSTGVILLMATRPGRWPEFFAVATAPLAAAAVIGLERAGGDPTPWGAFEGFSTAILLWGWFELAFLAGVVLGPSRAPCPPDLPLWPRFRAAWRALSHHELALAATLALLIALSWDQDNRTGLWTFAVLFAARISAKLNVFLGVPNLTEEFLPHAVRHLRSFFAKRAPTPFFWASVAALTLLTAALVQRAYVAPPGSGAEAGFALISTLCALAVLEHWAMVLPVQDAALWRWLLPEERRSAGRRRRAARQPARVD